VKRSEAQLQIRSKVYCSESPTVADFEPDANAKFMARGLLDPTGNAGKEAIQMPSCGFPKIETDRIL